ncbi:MAG TPA: aminotransferase class V-fold PLP-dependent enzyme [Gammaproteobacteria bacterium]|nr:aminotransferase class V-fold PLP-dependent enzyme [Gammaproteobacteria bacterium]
MDTETLINVEFPQDEDLIYLNHAAVSPWPQRSCDAVCQFAIENTRFGAKNYPQWLQHEKSLRQQLQQLINAPSADDIALVKNTSEALSMVACGIDWRSGDNVVSTDQEFPSNRIAWQAQQREGVEFREVDIGSSDAEEALIKACDQHTRVLTISSVQFGSGIRLDLEKLGQFCRRSGILFCVDAIQSIGAHMLDVQAIEADFVMADAHKWMLGPEGIGLFYCRADKRDQLRLYEFGWHMLENTGDYDRKDWQIATSARRFECGSPNMLGGYALSASLSLILEVGMRTIEEKIRDNTALLIDALQRPGITLLTPPRPERRAGIVTFRVENADMAALHQALLQENVICAHRYGGIRFSPHFYTRPEKINNALEVVLLNI